MIICKKPLKNPSPQLKSSEALSLINFTDLNEADYLQVLDWRNHEKVRRWMTSDQEISLKEHLAFRDVLRSDDSKLYLFVTLQKQSIGVLDFYAINPRESQCYYGYYLKPGLIGSSLGLLMEFLAAEVGFYHFNQSKVIAETLPDNSSSLRLHKFFGFEELGKNDKGLLVSHLLCSDWEERRKVIIPQIERLI